MFAKKTGHYRLNLRQDDAQEASRSGVESLSKVNAVSPKKNLLIASSRKPHIHHESLECTFQNGSQTPKFHSGRPRLSSEYTAGSSEYQRIGIHPQKAQQRNAESPLVQLGQLPISELLSQRIDELGQQIFVLAWKNERRTERLAAEIMAITQKCKKSAKRVPSESSLQYSKIDTLRKFENQQAEQETQFGSTCQSKGYSAHAYLSLDENLG